MDTPKSVVKILMTGLDEELIVWLRDTIRARKLPWKLRTCEPIRMLAPDNQLAAQDVIIVAWDRLDAVSLDDVVSRVAPAKRSLEGLLYELDKTGGEELCERVLVAGKMVTREDAILLAEYNIKHIMPLHEKRSKWVEFEAEIIKRIEKIAEDAKNSAVNPEDKLAARFAALLPFWSKISDETKMHNTEQLLRVLGDTPRYSELMARKCIIELDYLGAEKWLQRALAKNANFMRATHLMADVYMATRRFDDALQILEKLKANNPRSLKVLTRLGQCYSGKSEPMRAEKHLTDALSIDEFSREAREELGKIKFAMSEYETARQLFSQVSAPQKLASYFNKIGIQLVQDAKYAASIEHYRWAQYVLPGNEQSHLLFFNIALAYAKWGRTSHAIGYARLARIRVPDYDKAAALLKKLEERLSA